MTEIEQVRALAELDGIIDKGERDGYFRFSDGKGRNYSSEYEFSPYLTSYDAIIPLIQKQPTEKKWLFIANLVPLLREGQFQWDATPVQLCEAMLRATGKWKD